METDWWTLVPDWNRTSRIPEPLLALDGRVFPYYYLHHESAISFTPFFFSPKFTIFLFFFCATIVLTFFLNRHILIRIKIYQSCISFYNFFLFSFIIYCLLSKNESLNFNSCITDSINVV